MKIKPIKQAFKETVADTLPKPRDGAPPEIREDSLNISYGMFQMGYLLGAATALLEQLPESKEDILNHKCVTQNYLIPEN